MMGTTNPVAARKPDVGRARVQDKPNDKEAKIPPVKPDGHCIAFHCATEEQISDGLAVYANKTRGVISFYPRESEISFKINLTGCSEADAKHAATEFRAAVAKYNSVEVGVHFKEVGRNEPAHFTLDYQENKPGQHFYASAFSPSDMPSGRPCFIHVYDLAFKEVRKALYNVFLHEIGHVLGLRHYFVREEEDPKGIASTSWGENNERSIMNYWPDWRKAKLDKEDIKALKHFYAAEKLNGVRIVRSLPKLSRA